MNLKLYECKTPIGNFYIYCENEKQALKIFRERFTLLEVAISEVIKPVWIASGDVVMSVMGHSSVQRV